MDLLEAEDSKDAIITLEDFPFICRICCLRRNNLRLFEEEDYLWDLFLTLRNIDVDAASLFPRNICDECINKLQDILMFIDISKNNDSKSTGNLIPKREMEYLEAVESGTSCIKRESFEEHVEEIYPQEYRICRICSSSGSLTPFEEKKNLMQLFQDITNIDVKTEIDAANGDLICDSCIDKLEEILSFRNLSFYNDGKFEYCISKNNPIKTESFSNSIDINLSRCKDEVMDTVIDGPEEKYEIIDIKEENFSTYNDLKLETIIDDHEGKFDTGDVKEGIFDSDSEAFSRGTYQNGLKLHLQTPPEKPFIQEFPAKPCSISHTEHEEKVNLSTDTGEKSYKCDQCEESFDKKSHLNDHLLIHTGEKPFKCHSCGISFTRKQSLQRHLLTHNREKPFNCDCCDKTFTKKSSLKRHLHTLAGGKLFKCECCDKSFSQNQQLQRHSLMHTREKPFKCDYCDRTFSLTHNLKLHVRTHTGEKPYECNRCGKTFARSSCRKRHLRTHTGGKPYKCCDKIFTQTHHFEWHLRNHHEEALI